MILEPSLPANVRFLSSSYCSRFPSPSHPRYPSTVKRAESEPQKLIKSGTLNNAFSDKCELGHFQEVLVIDFL
ncbi:hypothetical protein PGT21_011087 [Puccinia graminis f. sp. tritici]|uniref:Uncharacterized protein n=1 Tax=Puccinia graminis f. sp. tritici TaxID=56615 RepID=A0A5B0QHW0_PUCGR|nr:hypothetical protein PGT21_011087 [Puccinia graminis f. sp. tritici]